jgi:hypothetical protein
MDTGEMVSPLRNENSEISIRTVITSHQQSEKAPSYRSYPSPGFADEKNAYYSMYSPTEIPELYESEYAIPQTNEKYAPRYGYSHPRLIDPYSEKPTPGLPPHGEASNTVSAGQGPDIPEDNAGDNSQGGLKDYIVIFPPPRGYAYAQCCS